MKAMILAAGLGTRLRPLTDKIPKPAVPLLNVPMLLYNEFLLRELPIRSLVINTHHLSEQIRSLQSRLTVRDVHWSHEQPEILGSGGGIWNAKKYLAGESEFVVANGDNVLIPTEGEFLKKFVDRHYEERPLATLMAIEHPDAGTKFNALWVDDSGQLLGVGTKKLSDRGYHFVGVQMYSQKIFDYLPVGESSIFGDVLLPAIESGAKVTVHLGKARWFETGDEKNYLVATQELANILWSEKNSVEKIFLQHLLQAHAPTMKLPAKSEPFRGSGSIVERGCNLTGVVVLGHDVKVLGGASLENVVVLENTVIPPSTTSRNRIIF
jgi:mannose-1-phosphate guanylyltransferase